MRDNLTCVFPPTCLSVHQCSPCACSRPLGILCHAAAVRGDCQACARHEPPHYIRMAHCPQQAKGQTAHCPQQAKGQTAQGQAGAQGPSTFPSHPQAHCLTACLLPAARRGPDSAMPVVTVCDCCLSCAVCVPLFCSDACLLPAARQGADGAGPVWGSGTPKHPDSLVSCPNTADACPVPAARQGADSAGPVLAAVGRAGGVPPRARGAQGRHLVLWHPRVRAGAPPLDF